MFRYLQFFIACAVVIAASVYWPLNDATEKMNEALSSETLIHQQLKQEAALVGYFCLSAIPPTSGKATIPREWERALHSSIQLREHAGVISGGNPEFKPLREALVNLAPGNSVYARGDNQHSVAYRPPQSPNWYLVVSKANADFRAPSDTALPASPLAAAISAGLISALILTLIARFVIGTQPRPNE